MPTIKKPRKNWIPASFYEPRILSKEDFKKIAAILGVKRIGPKVRTRIQNSLNEFYADMDYYSKEPTIGEMRTALERLHRWAKKENTKQVLEVLKDLDERSAYILLLKFRQLRGPIQDEPDDIAEVTGSGKERETYLRNLLKRAMQEQVTRESLSTLIVKEPATIEMVSKAAESILKNLQQSKRGRRRDDATDLFIVNLSTIYSEVTGKKAGVGWDTTENKRTAPFFRFIMLLMPSVYSEAALGQQIKRALKAYGAFPKQ